MFYLTRSINPVGQGAFYTEKIKIHNYNEDRFNIVYDCGSENINALINEIHGVFKKDTMIDAVFLSHFDSDHINGLDTLLEHCYVRKLFIPLLKPIGQKLVLLHLLCSGISMDSSIYRLVEGDRHLFSERETEIIAVSAEDDKPDYIRDKVIIDLAEKSTAFFAEYREIASGSKIVIREISDWVWIPFNFKFKDRHAEFINELNDKGIIIDSTTDVADLWVKHKSDLIAIYKGKKITGDINTNSMVVYSGPLSMPMYDMDGRRLSMRCYKGHVWIRRYPSYCLLGCMYLGDYDANGTQKWNSLVNAYSSYLHMVGVWQLPHHGSVLSYNDKIAKEAAEFYFCSAGAKNTYHHPSGYVFHDVLLNGKEFLQIDETINSRVVFTIGRRYRYVAE